MTPGTILRCLTTGRLYTVVIKRKPKKKNGYIGDVKVVHLKAGHIEMSVRVDLVSAHFEAIE